MDVTFTFKGAKLAGKSLVAFEFMEHDGVEYMVHADINDVDQTVNIVDISTQARDAATGTHEGTIGESVKLIDTVAYTGLTPGNTYRMFTTLMDKFTGSAISGPDGLPLVGTTEFTPDEPDGTIDVEMTIDTRELEGHDIVFFEKLADIDENVVATHDDINDEDQTVSFPDAPVPGKGYPKTGGLADMDPMKASVMVVALCAIGGAYYAYIRRSRRQIAEIDAIEQKMMEEELKD